MSGTIPSAEVLAERLASSDFQRDRAVELLAAELGYLLRQARLARGLKQEELAAIVGVPVRTIRKMERGEYIEALRLISDIAFACDVEITLRLVGTKPASVDRSPEGGDACGSIEDESAVGASRDAPTQFPPHSESIND